MPPALVVAQTTVGAGRIRRSAMIGAITHGVHRRYLGPASPVIVRRGIAEVAVADDGAGHPTHYPFLIGPVTRMRGISIRVLKKRCPIGRVGRVLRVIGPPQPPGPVRPRTARTRCATGGVPERCSGLNATVIGPECEVPVFKFRRVSVIGRDPGFIELVPGIFKNLQSGSNVFLVVGSDFHLSMRRNRIVACTHAAGHLPETVAAVRVRIINLVNTSGNPVVVRD
jgi:hypothetical protein